MAMNGQGSFWSAFGVRFGNSSSAIDEILEREGHTLEELLDHDDIIQECKYMNSSLIEYLSQKDVVEKLIKYVIAKPPELKTPDEKPAETKYPYVASELFACEVVSMLDVMFENQDLLELLFSFLDRKPPIDPSCAGYFRKVVVVLIQKKYEQLVKFIQGRGIVEKLVEHIGLYSIMELLIMIGWDDGLGQVNDVQWLYKEKLIPMLVSKLDPQYEKDEEVHVNAARALVDVVVKCPPSASSLLVTHLQSAPMLEKIFQYMLSGSLSSLNNCLSVVIVLVQRDANRRSEFPYDKIELGMPPVIELVQKNLATILSVLTKPPKPTELKTQFGSLNPPFGETRMKAVELLLVLFRSNYPKINEDLAKLKAIPPVLECFLAYPWNNMLHGLVESILRTVIDSDSEVLKKALFAESKLIDAFIRGHQLNNEACAKPKGNRLGYMGHLLRMCNAVVAAVEKDQQIKQFMGDDMKAWTEFVNGPLAKENERQQTVIGGHRPTSPFRQGEEAESQDPLGNSLDAQQQQYANSFPEANSNDDDDDDEDGRRLGYPGRAGQDFGNQPNDDDDDEDWANNVPVQFSPEWTPNFEQGQGAEQGGNAGAGQGQGAGDANGQGAGSAESGKKGAKKPGMFDDDDDDSDSDEDEFNPRTGAPSKKAEAKDGQGQAGSDGSAGSSESPKKEATPVKSDGPASVLPSDVLGSSPPAT